MVKPRDRDASHTLDAHRLCIYKLCRYAICLEATGPRAEEGERRAPDPLPPRGAAPSRLRDQQVDRRAIRRPPPFQGGLPLSLALSPRGARLDHRKVDRESRRAPAPLLSVDP